MEVARAAGASPPPFSTRPRAAFNQRARGTASAGPLAAGGSALWAENRWRAAMKRLTLAVSALALVATGSAVAFAADAPAHRDQALTRAEAQAKAGQLFDRLDVNHDGKLDAADRAARFNAIFDTIDTNHDGQISRDEFLAAHEHMRGMMGGDHMGPDHMGHDGPPPDGEPGMGRRQGAAWSPGRDARDGDPASGRPPAYRHHHPRRLCGRRAGSVRQGRHQSRWTADLAGAQGRLGRRARAYAPGARA